MVDFVEGGGVAAIISKPEHRNCYGRRRPPADVVRFHRFKITRRHDEQRRRRPAEIALEISDTSCDITLSDVLGVILNNGADTQYRGDALLVRRCDRQINMMIGRPHGVRRHPNDSSVHCPVGAVPIVEFDIVRTVAQAYFLQVGAPKHVPVDCAASRTSGRHDIQRASRRSSDQCRGREYAYQDSTVAHARARTVKAKLALNDDESVASPRQRTGAS